MGCSKDTTTGAGGGGGSTTSSTVSAGGGTSTVGAGGAATTSASTGGAGGATSASSTSTTGASTSSTGASTSSTGASTGTTSASGSTSTSTGSGGGSACTEITAPGIIELVSGGGQGSYGAPLKLNLGTPATDRISVLFNGSTLGAGFNGGNKGTFNLASGGDANNQTCSRCVVVQEDAKALGPTFFQKSGTLAVAATSDQLNGVLNATITDLTLIEVTIDSDNVSTPVPNGACLHLASATIAATPLVAPAAWTCDSNFYADGHCDCGCGAFDPDCVDATVSACDFCDDDMSCSTVTDCPGMINPTNNLACTP